MDETRTFDVKLKKIKDRRWLPWIGKAYNGLFIIGDSFYLDKDGGWPDNDKDAQRNIIRNQGLSSHLDDFKSRRLQSAVEKVILNKRSTTYDERADFWTSVAFHNLVQRTLPSRKKEDRPTDSDFDSGWKIALEIIEIIKPKAVIVLGLAGKGRLGYILANENTSWKYNRDDFKKKLHAITIEKKSVKTKILFINHPTGSRGFIFAFWHLVIKKNFPEIITFIKKSRKKK